MARCTKCRMHIGIRNIRMEIRDQKISGSKFRDARVDGARKGERGKRNRRIATRDIAIWRS